MTKGLVKMGFTLTEDDKNYIWRVVDHAAKEMGGYHCLFASPLEFTEDANRVQFNWPVWMRAIKAYINSCYGENATDKLLLDILAEVYDPVKYQQYLDKQKHSLLENDFSPAYLQQKHLK